MRIGFLLALFFLCGCAGSSDQYATRIVVPKYPRVSNVNVKEYSHDLSSVPIRTRVTMATPFIYDGKDTRFFKLKVLDDIRRRDHHMIIPAGSTLFGVQNKNTGLFIDITRYRKDDYKAWTPAYGIGQVAPVHKISIVYLSKISSPEDDD